MSLVMNSTVVFIGKLVPCLVTSVAENGEVKKNVFFYYFIICDFYRFMEVLEARPPKMPIPNPRNTETAKVRNCETALELRGERQGERQTIRSGGLLDHNRSPKAPSRPARTPGVR